MTAQIRRPRFSRLITGLSCLMLTAASTASALTFTVINTGDSGSGSLRDAIVAAETNLGPDTITFNIPGAGLHTIQPASPLPTITDPVVIDGTSQSGYSGTPLIELDGTNAGANATGLIITAGNSTVKGLAINRFDAIGISLFTSGSNTIGGTDPARRNVISGNQIGLRVSGGGATGNVVQGNYIGTNAAGDVALGNFDGVAISTPGTVFGGTAAGAGNLVSGNAHYGLDLGSGVVVEGNLIGTKAAGTAALGNVLAGVNIANNSNNTIGGTAPGARNIISGNGIGVNIAGASATGNTVLGNYIGTDINGTAPVGNGDGVQLQGAANGNTIGRATAASRNIISGNNSDGIQLFSGATNNQVLGNFIGTDATGTLALGNAPGSGVNILSTPGNIIGGTTPGAGNVLSGNGDSGVAIGGTPATGNLVQGNLIGTNAAGTSPIGNNVGVAIYGVASNNTVGGITAGARNIISGNNQMGVSLLTGTGNVVQDNFIGTEVNGIAAMGNGQEGVRINAASDNAIGGTDVDAGNTIAHNGGEGVFSVSEGTGNAVLSNVIHSNAGLGIDLFPVGVSSNDAGDTNTGDNNLQNFPVLTQALDGSSTVSGTLNSTANTTFRVELFANSACDLSGFGEGATLLGSADVTTDTNGDVGFTAAVAPALVAGEFITSTATDPGNNTSEFAKCLEVIDPLLVTNTSDSGQGSLRAVIDYANGNAGLDVIRFAIPGAGPHAIQQISELPNITDPVIFDGTSQPGYSGTPIVEIDGSALISGAPIGLDIRAGNSTVRGLMVNGYSLHAGIFLVTNGGNTVEACYLGVDATGTIARGNGVGLKSASSNNLIVDNLISGNGKGLNFGAGATGNVVRGNLIGTDASGTTALSNTKEGILLSAGASNNTIGGTTPAERNIISGNIQHGVHIRNQSGDPTGNVVQGNYIGTDINGTIALPNGTHFNPTMAGVNIAGASNNTIGGTASGAGNLISGNDKRGISINRSLQLLVAHDNLVQGNLIGTDHTGTSPLPNKFGILVSESPDNIIGGTDTAARNLISGNTNSGVYISGAIAVNNLVQGNYIGTDLTGNTAIGNSSGISLLDDANGTIIGGTTAGAGNLISGNVLGIGPNNSHNILIYGNLIGTDASGTNPLGNTQTGIEFQVSCSDNIIGGTAPGMANTIAYNGEMGIQLNANSGNGNAISGNSIHSNTTLGIDINSDGVTANDPDDVDAGANNLQNYPVLTQAFGGSFTVSGTLNSTANTTFRIELFANSACDPSGFGEGATFLGSANVSTDLNGDATFAASISGFSAGQFISATATDPSNNTSEFSACIEADLNQPPVADAGENQIVECGTPAGTDVTLDGTGSSDPDDDDLTYAWSEDGLPLATGPTPTVTLSPGTHTIDLVVNDGLVDSPPDQVQIQITDTSPPVITLLGADPILVEVGTPYTDPGATALDACDGDLTSAIIVANPVDSNTEGEYTVTYTVADAAGNPASAPRTVEVVSTPNSYVLVAAHSMHIKQHATVHSGFAGVVDYGTPPFQAGRVELVIGPHAFTETDVRVSSPRVRIKNKATIAGTLVYDELKVGRHVTIGEHVTPGTWPLFEDFGLPDFVSGTPGTVDILVRKRETVTLSPEDGPFGTIRVKHKGSLILTGGEYHIGSMHPRDEGRSGSSGADHHAHRRQVRPRSTQLLRTGDGRRRSVGDPRLRRGRKRTPRQTQTPSQGSQGRRQSRFCRQYLCAQRHDPSASPLAVDWLLYR